MVVRFCDLGDRTLWPDAYESVSLPAMAQEVVIHQVGGPEELKFEAVPDQILGVGEARVVHRAIGVNFIDTYHRTGLYPLPHYPSGIGLEAAGVVEEVGAGVTEVAPG